MDSSPAFGLCERFTVWSKLTKKRRFLKILVAWRLSLWYYINQVGGKNVHKFPFNFGKNVVSILTIIIHPFVTIYAHKNVWVPYPHFLSHLLCFCLIKKVQRMKKSIFMVDDPSNMTYSMWVTSRFIKWWISTILVISRLSKLSWKFNIRPVPALQQIFEYGSNIPHALNK